MKCQESYDVKQVSLVVGKMEKWKMGAVSGDKLMTTGGVSPDRHY